MYRAHVLVFSLFPSPFSLTLLHSPTVFLALSLSLFLPLSLPPFLSLFLFLYIPLSSSSSLSLFLPLFLFLPLSPSLPLPFPLSASTGRFNVNHFKIEYPHIPAMVDFVSNDDYESMGCHKNAIWFYKKFLYPLLLPHQRVLVVPPTFNLTLANCSNGSWLKDIPTLDECIYRETLEYFRWIDEDELIIGLNGFHIGTYGHDIGLVDLPKSLACYVTLGAQLNHHAASQAVVTETSGSTNEIRKPVPQAGSSPIELEINCVSAKACSYGVSINGSPALMSGSIATMMDKGAWASAGDDTLKFVSMKGPVPGADKLGSFERTEINWAAPGLEWQTAFRKYFDHIVFEQTYGTAVTNLSFTGRNYSTKPGVPCGHHVYDRRSRDSVHVDVDVGNETNAPSLTCLIISPLSSFPSWRADSKGAMLARDELGTLFWSDIGNGYAGNWDMSLNDATNYHGDRPVFEETVSYTGGWECSGVVGGEADYGDSCDFPGTNLALFNRNQSIVMISSALTEFDNVVQQRVLDTYDGHVSFESELRTGVVGSMKSIPAGHHSESIIHFGFDGINKAYHDWGATLLKYHDKTPTTFDANLMVSHLGYSTTANYFYSTEGATVDDKGKLIPGLTFQQTIIDVYDDAERKKIPYRYFLLDSWWYGEYDHSGSGMYSWDESSAKETDELNPKGRFPNGLAFLHNRLGGRAGAGNFVQHMGKWRSDTHYAKVPEWGWTTHVRQGSNDSLLSAGWTDSAAFYDSLYGNATDWGLIAAKHDHVQENIPLVDKAMEEIGYIGRVLKAEHDGLRAHGASVMCGGYTMIGWMNSVRLPGVTHARVSMDYACWNNGSENPNNGCKRGMGNYFDFNTGPPSMLSWALGILPYKDSFFSSSDFTGPEACMSCLFSNWSEPYPRVQAIVSSLSAGPIAPGDAISKENRSLIMMTARSDGVLLKPDRPATPIDSYWSVRAFGTSQHGPHGELWATETSVACGDGVLKCTYHYAFGTMLESEYTLTLSELVKAGSSWTSNDLGQNTKEYIVWDLAKSVTSAVVLGTEPLRFARGEDYGSATYFIVCPVLANGWSILGEVDKIIPLSQQRILSIVPNMHGVMINLIGAPNEQVIMAAWTPEKTVKTFHCHISESGSATLSIPSGDCV
eukprot:m.258025 g.258025  ORF g.258025 m.258025 type:complete len:1139 (+) comp36016_c0_seq1:75-3491(+)